MKYFTQCGGDLDEIDQDRAPVPPRRLRQFPVGRDALQRQKGRRNDHHGERRKGEVEHGFEHGLNQISRDSITVIPRTAGWRLS